MIFMSSARVYAISCWWLIITLALFLADSEIWLEDSAVGIWSAGDRTAQGRSTMIQELSTNYSLVVNCHVGIFMYALTRVGMHRHPVLATSLHSVHASGTKSVRSKNFEHVKIFCTTWHAIPHSSRTPHDRSRSLRELARSNACQFVNQIRASVNWPNAA